MLPMLENAVKYCSSIAVSKPWIGVDISVKHDTLRCKIANSKDEGIIWEGNSMSICNLRKRLDFFYPENHEMRMSDEGNFMVISMMIRFNAESRLYSTGSLNADSKLSVSV
jgi:LytS/YehU family sensor histidine kinase